MNVLRLLVGFGRLLRARGLPVGTGRILTFYRAVGVLQPVTKDGLYWAARSALVSNHQQFEAFDEAFAEYFTNPVIDEIAAKTASEDIDAVDTETIEVDHAPGAWLIPDEDEAVEGEVAVGVVASAAEVLKDRSFDELTDEELTDVAALIRNLRIKVPQRRVRRSRRSPRGREFDLRRTLRYSLRTEGEPFRRAWMAKTRRARPLVLLLDVSGSMSPYASALLQFGFAAMAVGHKVEVFCFGTRLTRITRALQARDPSEGVARVFDLVQDSEGGTRIGDSLNELLRRYGQHGFLRGSVLVLCSDGLDRGDPDSLAAAMQRLTRIVHRTVWVNPLKGSPRYQPLAQGMAAALPHIDVFLPGHNLASLEALGRILDELQEVPGTRVRGSRSA
jgi:uncharacterized protein